MAILEILDFNKCKLFKKACGVSALNLKFSSCFKNKMDDLSNDTHLWVCQFNVVTPRDNAYRFCFSKLMLHDLASATIQVANLVNYVCYLSWQ